MTTQPGASKSRSTRWYDDACGAAHGLELLGERWALLVVRELMFGGRRFSELRAGLPGISANVLTQRLDSLEAAGIVRRRDPPSSAYELTAWGYEVEPIIQALGRWAARSATHDANLPLSTASLLLSFRTMLQRPRAQNLRAKLGLHLDGESFVAHLHEGELTISREPIRDVDVTLTASTETLAGLVYGGLSLTAATADGSLTVEGDRSVAKRFLGLFSLPPKLDAPRP